MKHSHPLFTLHHHDIFSQFLAKFRIVPSQISQDALLQQLCFAFSQIPYENLTKIIKSENMLDMGRAKRLPDEVLQDYLRYGSGGTCFSLTAAFIAILHAFGIEALPVLADRRYGTDTHCALIFSHGAGVLLLDPGYLIHTPTRLPTTEPLTVQTGVNILEFVPQDAGQKVELFTIVKNDRRSRLTYKVSPVDGETFGRAWERSFAWEMMTYPVLTRYHNGVHYYLQGDVLRIRKQGQSTKQVLSPDKEQEFITKTLGIHPNILKEAWKVV